MRKTNKTNKYTSLITFVGIILIILGIAITYTSKIIDFDDITAPFEDLTQGTIISEWINEAKQARLERELKTTENPAQVIRRYISEIPGLSQAQKYYITYQSYIERFENSVAELPNMFIIAVSILLLFAIKSMIVLIPASATCLVTSLLFPFKTACFINFLGYALIFTGKYVWGKYVGEGYISKLVKKTKYVYKFVQDEEYGYANGNPVALFLMRLVPTVPINPISAMYGHMGYNYWEFIAVSLLGVAIRIITVTAIGCNVSDPFSSKFAIPLVLILLVSGISMIALSTILKTQMNKGETTEKAEEETESEEEAEVEEEAKVEEEAEENEEVIET